MFKPAMGVSDPDALHRTLNDTALLIATCRDILGCLAVRPLLERITERALAVTSASATAAYLLGDSPGALSLQASAGTSPFPDSISLDDESPISSAVRNRYTCSGVTASPTWPESMTVIAIPISGQQQPAGVLALAKTEEEFSIDDMWFLGEFAIMAGLGIDNCRLIESLGDLRVVDKAKSRFVALLMHQIGSPLATIAVSLRAVLQLEASLDPDERRKMLECSMDRVRSITALSKKLLDLGAIRRADYLADIQELCASSILCQEVEARRMQARHLGLEINLKVRDREATVLADPAGLCIIFNNLLDNAIKYSAGKGMEIQVSSRADAERLCVCVRDEGIGIPADERHRVFEEFRRAGNAVASDKQGFGLGLTFVKELVDRYKGRIEVESEYGVGTSVTVEFPLSTARRSGGDL